MSFFLKPFQRNHHNNNNNNSSSDKNDNSSNNNKRPFFRRHRRRASFSDAVDSTRAAGSASFNTMTLVDASDDADLSHPAWDDGEFNTTSRSIDHLSNSLPANHGSFRRSNTSEHQEEQQDQDPSTSQGGEDHKQQHRSRDRSSDHKNKDEKKKKKRSSKKHNKDNKRSLQKQKELKFLQDLNELEAIENFVKKISSTSEGEQLLKDHLRSSNNNNHKMKATRKTIAGTGA